MRALLSNHRQSIRKTRLVADLVRGKKVTDAQELLSFTDKKAADVFKKLIQSAVANARAIGATEENLFIERITTNQGVPMKRHMPQARGSAHPFRKEASHIEVVLGVRTPVAKKKVAKKRTASKKK